MERAYNKASSFVGRVLFVVLTGNVLLWLSELILMAVYIDENASLSEPSTTSGVYNASVWIISISCCCVGIGFLAYAVRFFYLTRVPKLPEISTTGSFVMEAYFPQPTVFQKIQVYLVSLIVAIFFISRTAFTVQLETKLNQPVYLFFEVFIPELVPCLIAIFICNHKWYPKRAAISESLEI
eukprot:TRINITY_DN3960_c0_g1_i2.p1 TRINITY_DN3960_c0_g1~~TRINITY_DN3960_c0_g1_i2.p1  ORF type:complete len:182 (+),score=11.98 TRINITY_DN3960_c0_g1_i2:319-864(+)